MGLDVHHDGNQPRRLGHTLAVLDALQARGRDEDFHLAARSSQRPGDGEVQADLVQRKGDVLLDFQPHQLFQFVVTQPGRHHHAAGHHGRCGQGQRHAPLARGRMAQEATNRCDDSVEILDLPLADAAPAQRFRAEPLQRPAAPGGRAKFHQAHAAGADVQPHQGRALAAHKPRQELQGPSFPHTDEVTLF